MWRHHATGALLVAAAVIFISGNTMAQTADNDALAAKIKELEDEKKQLQLTKDIATLKKDTAEAEKAAAEAKLAQTKATFGGVPDSPIKGDVTVDSKGGQLEMALLAAAAINQATLAIGAELDRHTTSATLYLYPASATPNLHAVAAFVTQKELVGQALQRAIAEASKLTAASTGQESAKAGEESTLAARESVAAAGLAVESITKLLGFFRSDFKVGGSDISFEDTVLLQSLARVLHAKTLFVPTLYDAAAVTGAQTLVGEELKALTAQQQLASELGARLDTAIELRVKAAADPARTPEEKEVMGRALQALRSSSERIKTARAAFDTLLGRLLTSDEAAVSLLRTMATWKGLRGEDGQLLLVKVQNTGGSHYTEKNLWTFFGVMPFSVAGGTIVSYTLLKSSTGAVLVSGVRPIHGGFTSVKDVPALIRASALPPLPPVQSVPTGPAAAAAKP